jgi:TIR domain
MAIPQSEILRYEGQASIRKSAEVIREAKAARKQTAFLSHSHKDARIAKSVQAFLHAQGWDIYIDWDDTTMPDSPSRETALRIQSQIRDLTWFLFLATLNSMGSRWCPWEIGYADGVKSYDNILIIPTSDSSGSHGSEYMQLYRHIDPAQGGGYGAFKPDKTGIRIAALQPN